MKKLEEILNSAFKEKGYEVESKIIKSKEEKVDFQCDELFKLAKTYHKAPFIIGEEVVEEVKHIENFIDYFKSIECVKPGFINICVSDKFINEQLKKIMTEEKFGINLDNNKVVLDYGGPNVAKPLHVGHLRTAVIGQAINNILSFKGSTVLADVHLGDIGTQMGQVIYGILNDYPNQNLDEIDITLDYLNVTYPRISALCKENEEVKSKCLEITKKLQDELLLGSGEYINLWKKITDVSITDIKRLYNYLDVKFDYWYGESNAFKYYSEMMKYLEEKNIVKIDEGAKIIDVKEDTDKIVMPPVIIQKKDGAYLYATSDLGTIWQREKELHPEEIIYVVDARQSLHFTQVFRAAKKAQIYNGNLEFCGYGTVNGKDNKPFKTRSGDAYKLEDLINDVKKQFISLRKENKNKKEKDIDKIVNSILKFADLQNDLTRNYIFDIKKFSEVNGKTGPYILYTYLRINKLLENIKENLSDKIYNDIDRKLRLKLLDTPNIIEQSAKERKPHFIANYLYELCVITNNFYETNKLSKMDEKTKQDTLIILNFTNRVIKTLLELLGISIPEEM